MHAEIERLEPAEVIVFPSSQKSPRGKGSVREIGHHHAVVRYINHSCPANGCDITTKQCVCSVDQSITCSTPIWLIDLIDILRFGLQIRVGGILNSLHLTRNCGFQAV